FYRDVQSVIDGDHDAPFGGAIELGEKNAGDIDGFLEDFSLKNGVLAAGGIEHEQDVVWRARDFSCHDVTNFCELAHEIFLSVKAASGVNQQHINRAGNRGFGGVEGD